MVAGIVLALLLGVDSKSGAQDPRADSEASEVDPRRAAHAESIDPAHASSSSGQGLIARRDRRRLRNPIAFPVFGRELRISGRLTLDNEFAIDRLRRFDLRDPEDERARGRRPFDDEIDVDQRLEIDAFYAVSDRIAVYLAGQVEWRNLVYADVTPEVERSEIARKEAWVYVGDPFIDPLGAQIGAQRFSDDREWWWDRDLDAARIRWDGSRFSGSFAVAQQLFTRRVGTDRIDAEDEDVFRMIGEGVWTLPEDHVVALRVLHQDDRSDDYRIGECVPAAPGLFFQFGCIDPKREDESDARLTWIGGYGSGRVKLGRFGRLHYRADAAYLLGDEVSYDFAGPNTETGEGRRAAAVDHHEVRGYGFDVGIEWETSLPGQPAVIFSYAHGSGRENDISDRQRGFRQTGLHDNGDKFRGVATLDYYGELLEPELSNLSIWTAGVGVRLFRASSIDLLYHHYRQDELAPYLRDASLGRRPYGDDEHIGDEVDLVIGVEEWERLEIKTVLAMFRSGRAFSPGDGDYSYLASIRFRMNF